MLCNRALASRVPVNVVAEFGKWCFKVEVVMLLLFVDPYETRAKPSMMVASVTVTCQRLYPSSIMISPSSYTPPEYPDLCTPGPRSGLPPASALAWRC